MATLAQKLPYTHPFAGGYPYRGSQRLPSDPDALTYLAAVAAADGAPVEVGVAMAVDDFFRGIKADGTFSALKSAALLCGARTLAGALVPLVGAAPTNNNFVDADYNRETGLKGNGSTKYLDSGYAYAQNQDNSHIAIYRTEAGATTQNWIGAGNYNHPTRSFSRIGHYSGGIHSGMQGPLANVSQPSLPIGFAATERNDDENVSLRYNNVTQTQVVNSVSVSGIPGNFTVFVVSYSDIGIVGYSTQRAAFYSIGESLDLAALDARVTALVAAIGAAL